MSTIYRGFEIIANSPEEGGYWINPTPSDLFGVFPSEEEAMKEIDAYRKRAFDAAEALKS